MSNTSARSAAVMRFLACAESTARGLSTTTAMPASMASCASGAWLSLGVVMTAMSVLPAAHKSAAVA